MNERLKRGNPLVLNVSQEPPAAESGAIPPPPRRPNPRGYIVINATTPLSRLFNSLDRTLRRALGRKDSKPPKALKNCDLLHALHELERHTRKG